MPITWRPATWNDIEPSLAIQPVGRGDGLPDVEAALIPWKKLFQNPFFLSAVVESDPPIRGHKLIGFGAAMLVNSEFMDAEVSSPRPDTTSRIIERPSSQPEPLATSGQVAQANADAGVDVVIVYNVWRDEILNASQRQDLRVSFATSFADVLAGYRVSRILVESTTLAATDLFGSSPEYQVIAEFPETGHTIHLITRESAAVLPGSLGNVIFKRVKPSLRLRESDQQLLLAALNGATDNELAIQLDITPSAVKARWRSTFARIHVAMPDLVGGSEESDSRGSQKRHRVLAYVRAHMEELRPYDWKAQGKAKSLGS